MKGGGRAPCTRQHTNTCDLVRDSVEQNYDGIPVTARACRGLSAAFATSAALGAQHPGPGMSAGGRRLRDPARPG